MWGIFVIRAKTLLFLVLALVLILCIPNVSADEPVGLEVSETEEDPQAPSRPTVLPDLAVSEEDIEFTYNRIEEEYVIVINATITNYGFVGAYAYVEFYNGAIDNQNLIGSDSVFVKSRDVNVATTYWKTEVGEYSIHVLIRNSFPRELKKWNNAAESNANVEEVEDNTGSGGTGQSGKLDDAMGLTNIPLDNPAVSTGLASSCLLVLFAIANKHYMWISGLGALPLYSRITNGQVLKQDTRKNIYEYIESNPGVYFSSIMKDLKLKNGVTSYHLSMLEREGYIKSKSEGLYKRFYVNGASTQEIPLSQLRRSIVTTIVDNPGISQTDIALKLGLSNQVVNYHVGILKKANLIKIVKDGYRTKCYISPV